MSETNRPAVPHSPDALIALQRKGSAAAAGEGPRHSGKLDQLLNLVAHLEIGAWESQQLALSLVRHLEKFHDAVVAELDSDEQAPHCQVARWAIDADRLTRCRLLLEDIDLE